MEIISTFGLFIIVGIVLFLAIFFWLVPLGLWVTAYFSGVSLRLVNDLVGMRLRKVPPRPIVESLITASKAGLQVQTGRLEAHYLAGGDVRKVVSALISADKANIPLPFERAAAIDLAGVTCWRLFRYRSIQKLSRPPR